MLRTPLRIRQRRAASPRQGKATRRGAVRPEGYFLSSSSAVFSVTLGRMMAATFSSTGR